MTEQNLQVLLVEDNPGDARLIQIMLTDAVLQKTQHFSIEWKHAETFQAALFCLSTQKIDVVLLDLSLPDSEGLNTLRNFCHAAPNLPVIVLTGLSDEEVAIRAMQAGAQDYLVKGKVDPQLLVRTIFYSMERKRAQEALRESEERYRLLAENATDVIWTMDMDLRFTSFSPSIQRLLGYTPKEALQCDFQEILPPQSFEVALDVIRQEMTEENFIRIRNEPFWSRTMELEHIRKDGSKIWTEVKVSFLRDQSSYPIGILGTTRDIQKRKQVQDALLRSEERFRTAVETMLDGFAIFSSVRDEAGTIVDFRYEYINRAGCQLNQMPLEEHLGKTILELLPAHKEVGLIDQYAQVVETGVPLSKEDLNYEDTYGGGKRLLRAFDVRAVPFGDGFAVIWRDITERRRNEVLLKRRNQELALLNEASQAFNSTLDLDQVLQRVLEKLSPQSGSASSFWLVERETNQLICRQAYGPHSEIVRGWRMQPGEGLVGWAAVHGESVISPDSRSDNRHYTEIDQKTGYVTPSILTVPLKSREKVIGVLQLLNTKANAFDLAGLEMVESVASIASVAVENARLFEDAQRYARNTALMNDITLAAISAPNIQNMATRLADRLGELFSADSALIMISEEVRQAAGFTAAYDKSRKDSGDEPEAQLGPGQLALAAAIQNVESVFVVDDLRQAPHVSPEISEKLSIRSMLVLPLIADESKLGSALVGFNKPHHFTPSEISLGKQAADQIALALQKARLYAEVEQLAIKDELTGLHNRRGFFLLAEQQMKQALRSGEYLLLIYIDVDDFKLVNDTLGHQAGDRALVGIAQLLQDTFRSSDILARVGGDEFAVLALLSSSDQYELPVQRLKANWQEVNRQPDGMKLPSLSIGYALWQSQNPCGLDVLISQADTAMYNEKANKKRAKLDIYEP